MSARNSAPLLGRVKSWQLVGLGITGWITIYSTSIVCPAATNALNGNLQGGCFAATMALAGLEAKRLKKSSFAVDPLQWTATVSTEQVNEAVVQIAEEKNCRVEAPHPVEAEMGFGVRAVNSGRTWVYETARWKERVIDLNHAKITDENRKKVLADFAVIVGAGTPTEDTKTFSKTHPVQFLAGDEIKRRLFIEPPPAPKNGSKPEEQSGTTGETT